ncbi:MAG: hypothetical protein ACHQO8_05345, partial [Vicinamibacterales bacterium]
MPETRSYSLVMCAAALALACACHQASPTTPTEAARTLAISKQPQSQTVPFRATATLTVAGTGAGTLAYQWYVGASGTTTTPIADATAASYSTPGLTATTSYWVQVSDTKGHLDSTTATITVTPPDMPTITAQPKSVTISSGETATLSVEAAGTAPLSYQWYEMSHDVAHVIDGASAATFVTPAQTATVPYRVRV